VFPLPASASVCAFELEHADGRVLTGVAEETSEAARTFDGTAYARESAGLDQRMPKHVTMILHEP
jgi:hypothetical protein